MKFNKSHEYYIVKGWFDENGGIDGGTFYGAVATPDDYLKPKRVAISGGDACLASEAAQKQPAKVYPMELQESDVGGLNPKEREETQHLLLDSEFESWKQQVMAHAKDSNRMPSSPDDKYLYSLYMHGETPDGAADILFPLTEMTGTGGIAMTVMKSGMPDRGGHGRVDNLGPKKVKVGRNRNRPLKGFGDKTTMRTINQAGGRRGGNG